MMDYNFSQEILDTLKDINQKFAEAHSEKQHLSIPDDASDFWGYLKDCEQYFIKGTYNTESYTHDMENMFALFHLNDFIDKGHLSEVLRDFKLPKSDVTQAQIDANFALIKPVSGDGTIYKVSKYCQLDPLWSLVLVFYFYYKVRKNKVHEFVDAPKFILNENAPKGAKIAIIGDWGTGIWNDKHQENCPAELVIEQVLKMKPDYVIHLGDVYYAGTPHEEHKKFLKLLPKHFPGKFYTMNSNHEMYDGANGLMKESLKDIRFKWQMKSTYFTIQFKDWIIVGLDSAYYDKSWLYMHGSLTDGKGGKEQMELLTTLSTTGKQIMVLTHHNGLLVDDEGPKPNGLLWSQVIGALGNKVPDAWYWGHVHNGIVYGDNLQAYGNLVSNMKNLPKMRCCGHASIPFGNASDLADLSTEMIPYYAKTPMPDPSTDVQKLRVLNGFALLEISDSNLTETFYEVANGPEPLRKAWSSS